MARYETLQTVIQLSGRWNLETLNVDRIQNLFDFIGLSSAFSITGQTLTMAAEQSIAPRDPGEPVSP